MLELLETDFSDKSVLAEKIVDMIKRMGYIQVIINETTKDGEYVRNMLTLFSRPDEDFFVVALGTHKAMSVAGIGIGGVYDKTALTDIINMLLTATPAAEDETTEGGADKLNIGEILQTVVANIGLENGAVTINVKALAEKLVTMISGAPNSMISNAIVDIFGSETLELRADADGFKYGGCERMTSDKVRLSIREGTNDYASDITRESVKEITGIPGIPNGKEIVKGGSLYDYMQISNVGKSGLYKFNGKTFDGKDVVTSGYVYAMEGFDPNTVGKQKVKFYVAVVNDLYFTLGTLDSLLGISLNLDPMLPLYGALTFEVEVTVSESSEITADKLVKYSASSGGEMGDVSSISASAGTSWYVESFMGWSGVYLMQLALKAGDDYILLTEDDAKAAVIKNGSGETVTATDGVISEAGEYTVTLKKNGYTITVPLTVTAE